MPIDSPAPTDTRSRLADWLEVLALSSSRQPATRAVLVRLHDRLDDAGHDVETEPETGEELETEILEEALQEFADDVLEELEYREDVLETRYPFRIEARGPDWRVLRARGTGDAETEAARSAYLFCLLASALRNHRIRDDDIAQALPRVFQALATEAAAGVIGGESISFGWPRPDGSAFLTALRDASDRLRLGTPLQSVPLGSNGQPKDAGIDVIAWRDFADRRPGKPVLFGQVASGRNWTEKSVKNDIPNFLNGWFSDKPTEHFVPAIFIPFPQHHDCAGCDCKKFETVAIAEARRREWTFGLVVDRLRIVDTAAKRLVSLQQAGGENPLAMMGDWIDRALTMAGART